MAPVRRSPAAEQPRGCRGTGVGGSAARPSCPGWGEGGGAPREGRGGHGAQQLRAGDVRSLRRLAIGGARGRAGGDLGAQGGAHPPHPNRHRPRRARVGSAPPGSERGGPAPRCGGRLTPRRSIAVRSAGRPAAASGRPGRRSSPLATAGAASPPPRPPRRPRRCSPPRRCRWKPWRLPPPLLPLPPPAAAAGRLL